MRKYLEKLIAAKEKRAQELREQIKKAETADEVRALGDTLQAVMDELTEAKNQLDNLDKEDGQGNGGAGADEGRNRNPMHEFRQQASYESNAQRSTDPTDSVEYRTAFMNFVARGVPIPMELRDEVTTVTDAAAAIPTTYLQEIIREMAGYGEIFERVRRLNVQGGVEIPVMSLKPVANWVGEGASASQKLSAEESVSFHYHGLECKIAQSLLVNVVTLDAFQREFINLAAEAMVHALDHAIINGDGNKKPMGILNDTRVPEENKITLSATDFASWGAWKKKVFAKMRKAYRKGSFIMAQGTFDGYIDGMEDKNGQPIGRVNYGIADAETYRFGGKEVLTVEDDILPDYEAAEAGAAVAVFVDLKNYGINTNMEMQVVKWTDHDDNQVKNKAILVCDGKIIDPHGVLIIKKGA